jgi:type I restriction enzyme S subunit
MARALFKSWFVDFDPVRAKADGRAPAGMSAELAALFPDSFEDSPLGKVPRGWGVVRLDQVCEFAYGKALKADDRQPGDVAVYGSNGQVGWHNTSLVVGPGIIVGRKGNPGIVVWSQNDFFPIDTTFYVVPKADIPLSFLFFALTEINLPALGADSAVPGLNRNLAYMSDFLQPPHPIMAAFAQLHLTLTQRQAANEQQTRTLAALRDALLPRLLSGAVAVGAEGVV